LVGDSRGFRGFPPGGGGGLGREGETAGLDPGDRVPKLLFHPFEFGEERPGQQPGEQPEDKAPPGHCLDEAIQDGHEGFDRGEGRV
jgi:hypothetical protein